ncbi:hypothetical protein TSMEX_004100 [Taenia solium]|eukprot:TsM_000524700 transcript=TsM_000524700 gene=TsM_000524700
MQSKSHFPGILGNSLFQAAYTSYHCHQHRFCLFFSLQPQANRLDLCCRVGLTMPSESLADEENSMPEATNLAKRCKAKRTYSKDEV